jgi:hypothetical protein
VNGLGGAAKAAPLRKPLTGYLSVVMCIAILQKGPAIHVFRVRYTESAVFPKRKSRLNLQPSKWGTEGSVKEQD